jgi:hypothetical protein
MGINRANCSNRPGPRLVSLSVCVKPERSESPSIYATNPGKTKKTESVIRGEKAVVGTAVSYRNNVITFQCHSSLRIKQRFNCVPSDRLWIRSTVRICSVCHSSRIRSALLSVGCEVN